MLIRRLFLLGAIFFAMWPSIAMAALFPIQKRSNLPCLVGNPSFSELLIAKNPRLSGKAYSMSDAILGHMLFSIKRSMGPFSQKEIQGVGLPHFDIWYETLEYVTQTIESAAKPTILAECGIYLNRFSMLYFSTKCTYVLVVGNNKEPFNAHVSVGKFPIHFGSCFSDYNLASPLQADMGAAANIPAVSLNLENVWNLEHKSKARIFGFMQYSPKDEKYNGYQWGIHLNHEWKPLSKSVDSVNGGISWVQGLPFVASGIGNPDGADIYCHINAGSFKFKGEGLMGKVQEIWSAWGDKPKNKRKKQSKTTRDDSSAHPSFFSRVSSASKVSRGRPRERSSSRNQDISQQQSGSISFPYTLHAEGSYILPWKKDATAVVGYTWGNSGFVTAKQRLFFGVKVSLLDNLNCLVGYHAEEDLKIKVDGEVPRGHIPLAKRKSEEDEEPRRYYNEWRHSFTVQFSFSL